MLSDFVQCSQNDWEIGYSVIFGSGMLLIICLIFKKHLVILRRFLFFPASEIYFQKVKCFLSKKMKLQWNEDLTLQVPIPQNGQTHSNNCRQFADELFECV